MHFNRGAAYPMNIFIPILASLLIGLLTSHLAQKRGRDGLTWFIVGIFLGVFGLPLLYLLPSLAKQEKISPAKGSSTLPSMSVEAAPFNSRNSKSNDGREPSLAVTTTEVPVSKEFAEQKEKDWYYADAARQQQGPIPYEDLRLAFKRGDVTASSLVWIDGMAEWKRLDTMSEAYADFTAVPETDLQPF